MLLNILEDIKKIITTKKFVEIEQNNKNQILDLELWSANRAVQDFMLYGNSFILEKENLKFRLEPSKVILKINKELKKIEVFYLINEEEVLINGKIYFGEI